MWYKDVLILYEVWSRYKEAEFSEEIDTSEST